MEHRSCIIHLHKTEYTRKNKSCHLLNLVYEKQRSMYLSDFLIFNCFVSICVNQNYLLFIFLFVYDTMFRYWSNERIIAKEKSNTEGPQTQYQQHDRMNQYIIYAIRILSSWSSSSNNNCCQRSTLKLLIFLWRLFLSH